MNHVKLSDIHPELRLVGAILRLTNPFRSKASFTILSFLIWGGLKLIPPRVFGGEQIKIRLPGNESVTANIYRGKGFRKGEGPCYGILWLHGGGYAVGGPNQIRFTMAWRLLSNLNCVLLVPDYALSSVARYPKAIRQCWTALQWFEQHAAEYGVTEEKLIIGGESAGGGLSTAMTLYARDHGFDKLALNVALYPMLDCLPTETSADNDAPNWDTTANTIAWKMYLGTEPSEKIEKYASPSRETDWSNLPPTIAFAGTLEPFYSEIKTYVESLRNAGGKIVFREFENAFHGFDIAAPFASISKEATAFVIDNIKNLMEENN